MPHTPREQLLTKLNYALTIVSPGETWQHTKSGGKYIIVGLGINEKTEEIEIEYKELDHEPSVTWHRSFDNEDGWIIPTEIDGVPTPRFTKISD